VSYRPIGIAAAIAQLGLMTAYAALETVFGQGFWSGLIGLLTILVFPAVGLAILGRHPRHLVGLLFCVSQIGWAVNNLAGSYVRAGALPFTEVAASLYSWPGTLSGALFIVLLFVFPDGHFLSPRWQRLAVGVLGGTLIVALATAVAPGPIDPSIGVAVDNPIGLSDPVGPVAAAISGAGFTLQVPFFVVGAIVMVRRYRRSGTVEREQLKWFATSVVLMALLIVVALVLLSIYPVPESTPLWAQIGEQLSILSVSLVPIAAAIGILRYRLYDIDILIRRTLIYGSVLAALALAYFGGVVLVQSALRPFTSGSEIAVAASTLLTVALFQPVRTRVQRIIDRRFYRSRYDAARTLDEFSVRLRDHVALDAVRADLLAAARETVQPAHVSVWLRESAR